MRRAALWMLAVIFAVLAMRYFLVPVPWLPPPLPAAVLALMDNEAGRASVQFTPHMYAAHPAWLLGHIAFAVVALLIGPLQFSARRWAHTIVGMVYVVAVVGGGVTGFVMSCFMPGLLPPALVLTFLPVNLGFASLAIAWPVVTLIAYHRARKGRYDEHRAWMTRSYAITFAAVTVRLVAPVILFLTRDAVLTVNIAINTWPLNLLVVEWMMWRSARRLRLPQPAAEPLR
jgi:hypothetical protein